MRLIFLAVIKHLALTYDWFFFSFSSSQKSKIVEVKVLVDMNQVSKQNGAAG